MSEVWASRGAFVGRERELAVVRSCANAAALGEARVIWLEAHAGMGKSSLTQRALVELAGGFTTLRATAEEQDRDTSYATWTQLGVRTAASPFASALALVEHLNTLQATGPVAIVVEDMHWADPASRAALLTTARRLQHDHVVMLLTARPDPVDDGWVRFADDPERCVRLVLDGFDDTDVAALARHTGVQLSTRQASRLRRHTHGHPLHVHTLLHELTPAQLTAADGELPAPRSLAASTNAVLAGLPAPSRLLAAALAVAGRPVPLAVAAGIAQLDDPSAALEPLLDTGFVSWSPSLEQRPVAFTHPLHRAAVYDDLAPEQRRALHRACAAVTSWGTSWEHRVAAADGADDELAGELIGGARYEVERNDLSLAATYLSWASQVASEQSRREALLLHAARVLILDGQTSRAAELTPRLAGCAPSALRELVLGKLTFAAADAAAAERHLSAVASIEPPGEANRAARIDALGELARLHLLHDRPADAAESTRQALALRPSGGSHAERNVWWGLAVGEATTRGAPAGLAVLEQRLPAAPADVAGEDAELLVARGLLELCAGHTNRAVADMRAAFDLARAGFGFAQLPRAHLTLARALYTAGAWDESMVQARTALSLLDDARPWMPTQAESAIALVLAARGEWDVARGHVERALAVTAGLPTLELESATRMAAAALAHAQDDHHGVVATLRPLADGEVLGASLPLTMLGWWPMFVASLVETGRLDDASAQLERLRSAGAAYGIELRAHLADLDARLAAARGDGDRAEASFATAAEAAGPDHPALERALLHHHFGRLLRTRAQRRRAEDEMRLAHGLLQDLGATPYADRVEDDLRQSGTGAHRRRSRQPFELTNRELDVAALVKKGLTNKEVAAELYISAKAVEYHLRNVYAKLTITSRRELRDIDL